MEQKTDLRILRTYRSLNEAFTGLMEEKRFEDITVGELCERAMIRRTTFYKHFADKYEYFTFYIKEMRESFESSLAPDIAAYHADSYFISMGRELYNFISEHKKFVENVMESNMLSSLLDLLYDLIKRDLTELIHDEYRRRGGKPKRADCEMTAAFYSGGLIYTMRLVAGKRNRRHRRGFLRRAEPSSRPRPERRNTRYDGREIKRPPRKAAAV